MAVEGYENTEYYVIKSGDTLSKIAAKYYGDAGKYDLIFEANQAVIKDPDLIFPGQKIRIPSSGKVSAAASALDLIPLHSAGGRQAVRISTARRERPVGN